MIADWRYIDEPRGWAEATPAEKMAWISEATVELFKKAGLYPGDHTNRTIRRLTYEQMRREDEELDRLLCERLRNLK